MVEPGDLYLDANATSPLLADVRAALHRAVDLALANPSSAHRAGERSRRLLETARAAVAALLGGAPDEIVFTSGGTEANHLALFGHLGPSIASAHIVVSAIEHSSVLEAAKALEELGAAVDRVAPGADGRVPVDSILAALRPQTRLVALMAANNETGIVQPVEPLARLLRARSIPFHVDAVQAIGKLPFSAASLGASSVAVTAHKLGGPAGVGALWVASGQRLTPFVRGGQQERRRRGGTHNLLGILGFGAAADAVRARGVDATRLGAPRDCFERELLRRLPAVRVVGAALPRLPNTSSVTFPGADGTRLLAELGRRGLHAAAGSACQAGAPEPSHVLRAMGFPAADARATLRFSFLPEHDDDDARRAADVVAGAVANLARSGAP